MHDSHPCHDFSAIYSVLFLRHTLNVINIALSTVLEFEQTGAAVEHCEAEKEELSRCLQLIHFFFIWIINNTYQCVVFDMEYPVVLRIVKLYLPSIVIFLCLTMKWWKRLSQ